MKDRLGTQHRRQVAPAEDNPRRRICQVKKKNGEERLGLKCSELRQRQEKKNRPTGNKSARTDLARINFSIPTQQVLQSDYRGRRPLSLLI
jgi:hypothetical protein